MGDFRGGTTVSGYLTLHTGIPSEVLETLKLVDGANSGLDADLLDGKHASEFSLTGHTHDASDITSGTVSNADTLDGYHAGNAAGQIPINNGTLNDTLNADLLDGKHASEFALSHSHPYDNYQGWYFAVNGVQQDQITSGDQLNFKAGSNVTITRSLDDEITISSSYVDTNYYLSGVSHDGNGGDGVVTFTRSGLSNLTLDLSHTHSEYLTSYTNNYLTGVSGSGDGTVTFTRQGLGNLTWDASHSHSEYTLVSGTPSLTFTNTEQIDHTAVSGLVYFDENYYGDFSAFTGGNGGGLAVYNEDGWGALISTANMGFITGDFHGLKVQGATVATQTWATSNFNNYSHPSTKQCTYTAPVDSVNGKTGAVSLTYSDVGAASSGHGHTDLHSHSNKANLDTINQNLGTGNSPTFNQLTLSGNLIVQGNGIRGSETNEWIKFNGANDSIELYCNDVKRFEFANTSFIINSKFKIEYNSSKNSLDFVYTG